MSGKIAIDNGGAGVKLAIALDTSELSNLLKNMASNARGSAAYAAAWEGGARTLEYESDEIHQKLNKHPTGGLSNSLSIKVEQDRESAEAEVSASKVYALMQEEGSAAIGGIHPVRAKWLTFQTEDGQWHRVKHVDIPGVHYAQATVEDHGDEIIAAMAEKLTETL